MMKKPCKEFATEFYIVPKRLFIAHITFLAANLSSNSYKKPNCEANLSKFLTFCKYYCLSHTIILGIQFPQIQCKHMFITKHYITWSFIDLPKIFHGINNKYYKKYIPIVTFSKCDEWYRNVCFFYEHSTIIILIVYMRNSFSSVFRINIIMIHCPLRHIGRRLIYLAFF